ncbi:MAG: methyltransferase domain-containing protein [Actinomycetota bacterium]|nr:methyltransferase domain-containing protein [Actinomycetota bacterium]
MATYGFDPAWTGERDRMVLAESLLDPVTIRQLESIGVRAGMRCLEVGAGAGSVARWLATRVGPGGQVVATDIDTRFLDPGAGYEIRHHDIVSDPPLPAGFDVAHARLVLQHVPDKDRAVANLAAAVVPGGWLLVEELDFTTSGAAGPLGARSFARVERAMHQVLAAGGFDPAFGRRLPSRFRAAGLVDVEGRGGLSVVRGGSPYAVWYGQSIEALRPRLRASGLVSEEEVTRACGLLDDPGFELVTPVLISTRGRRPEPGVAPGMRY